MKIGYDTLIENPLNPSSALEYIQNLLRELASTAPEHEFFVFVSPKNRHLFTTLPGNVRLLNCFFSNENIPLRVLVQQLYVPILCLLYRLDVVFAINQIPIFAPCPTVVKTCSLHHHVAADEYTQSAKGAGRTNRIRMWYRRLMFDGSARRASIVVANSTYTKNCITEILGVKSSKIRVVYEAVDDLFGTANAQTSRTLLQERYKLTRPYVLYVSNLWHYKNPDGAIRAFASLRKLHGDDLDLVVVGPDDYCKIPELKALAAETGVGDRVRFIGKCSQEDLIHFYAAARVLFYPSLAETFGKPVVEGMRSGVPIVAAERTSLPEIVGGAGLLSNPSDFEAMAHSLHQAATDDRLRAELVRLGKVRCQLFSWAASARGTLQACLDAQTGPGS